MARGKRFVSGKHYGESAPAEGAVRRGDAKVKGSRLGTPAQYSEKADQYQGERYAKGYRGRKTN